MAFSSIIRFNGAVQDFFQHRKQQYNWTEEDIVYLVRMLLEGYPPLVVEAAIEAKIHHRVTWNQCPVCQISLSDEDKNTNFGFCPKCVNLDDDRLMIRKFVSKSQNSKTKINGPERKEGSVD